MIDKESETAMNNAVIDELGPLALSDGRLSALDAFEMGWRAAIAWERTRLLVATPNDP